MTFLVCLAMKHTRNYIAYILITAGVFDSPYLNSTRSYDAMHVFMSALPTLRHDVRVQYRAYESNLIEIPCCTRKLKF